MTSCGQTFKLDVVQRRRFALVLRLRNPQTGSGTTRMKIWRSKSRLGLLRRYIPSGRALASLPGRCMSCSKLRMTERFSGVVLRGGACQNEGQMDRILLGTAQNSTTRWIVKSKLAFVFHWGGWRPGFNHMSSVGALIAGGPFKWYRHPLRHQRDWGPLRQFPCLEVGLVQGNYVLASESMNMKMRHHHCWIDRLGY